MFLDYHILIESIDDPIQYKLLKDLHDLSQGDSNQTTRVKNFVDREKIKNLLCGVGRIIQYYNLAPASSLLDFNDPNQNYLWSVYEGQIKDGMGHGFARIIYGDSGGSYTGYYQCGNKSGKGILRDKRGNVVAQGIWKGNDFLLKQQVIDSLKENTTPSSLE